MAGRYILPAAVVGVVISGIAGVTMLANSPAEAATEAAAAEVKAKAPTPANPKVAEVGTDMILKSDVDQLYEAVKQRMGPQTPPLDKVFWTLVDQIAASRLIIGAAKAEGLDKSPEVQYAVKAATEQIVQEAFIRKALEGVDSDASLKPRYEKLVAAMKDEKEVRARHILVKDEALAKSLIEQINKGADFAKLAAENTTDPGSKANGGDLGFFGRGMMVPEFDAVAFALEPGKVAQSPIKTQFGWHVLKVEEVRPRTAPKFEEAKGDLLAQAQQEKINSTVENLRAKSKVQLIAAPGLPPLPTDKPAAEEAVPAAATPAE